MRTLYIYVIHAKHLTIRSNRFQNILRVIDDVAKRNDFSVKTQFIIQHEPSDISNNLAIFNTKTSYDPINVPDFDNQRYNLTIPILSNIEKHKEAWKQLQNIKTNDESDLYLIIEDDALLFPEFIQNLNDLFILNHDEWDMLSLGLLTTDRKLLSADDGPFLNFRNVGKILPSKEAYCLKKWAAKALLKQFDSYKYTMKIHLSYLLYNNTAIKVFYMKKQLFIDGSKLGIFPSSIHPTNPLIFNKEFVQMHTFIKLSPAEITTNLNKIRTIYTAIENIRSPDAMHLYGLLLYKIGNITEAEKIFTNGIDELKKQQGYINNQSEIVNILIQIYKEKQSIEIFDTSNAKYSVKTLSSLLIEE
jgi:hypothetical protein